MPDLLGDHAESLDAILIKVKELDKKQHPDLVGYQFAVLRNGPKATKIAKFWKIRDRHTGEVHHHYLTLQTLRHLKKDGWNTDEKFTVSLSDEDGSPEINNLVDFLSSVPELEHSGEYLVVNATTLGERLSQILEAISASDERVDLLSEILDWASSDEIALRGLMSVAANQLQRSKALIAALNYTRYSDALTEFREMVERDALERDFQAFLEENYWMFGSEYSELIDKRGLAAGIQLDFPLRRTVDGYLDIIEIKRPLNGKPLFQYDDSHKNYFQGAELSKAIAQAMNYVETLRADKYRIAFHEQLRVDKVRAKIVIGRDIDDAQVQALKRVLSELKNIEIITFDQLARIGQRIVDLMARELPFKVDPEFLEPPDIDNIPF